MSQNPQPEHSFQISELIAEAKRELAFRERAYPRWIEKGRVRPSDAARQIALMKAITRELEIRQQPSLL